MTDTAIDPAILHLPVRFAETPQERRLLKLMKQMSEETQTEFLGYVKDLVAAHRNEPTPGGAP